MLSFCKVDKSKSTPVTADLFVGGVHRQSLGTSEKLELSVVFFDEGGRTKPHTHSVEQVLTVVEGTVVVADDRERKDLGPGEVAVVKSGHWHWHGAAKGKSGAHMTLKAKSDPTTIVDDQRDWADF